MSKANRPKQVERVFESRYERGYRYLDRTGDVLLVLEELLHAETGKVWMPQEIQLTGAKIICPELELTLSFDSGKLVLIQQPPEHDVKFAEIFSLVLGIITGRFDLRTFTRYGMRSIRLRGTDTISEAEEISAKIIPGVDWMKFGDELRVTEASLTTVQENEDGTGYRLMIAPAFGAESAERIDERLRQKARQLPAGQREALHEQYMNRLRREKSPRTGLLIDLNDLARVRAIVITGIAMNY